MRRADSREQSLQRALQGGAQGATSRGGKRAAAGVLARAHAGAAARDRGRDRDRRAAQGRRSSSAAWASGSPRSTTTTKRHDVGRARPDAAAPVDDQPLARATALSFEDVVDDRRCEGTFAYIIVSPAMLSGGWSRAFLQRMIEDERHAVVFTGYLPPHARRDPRLHRLHTGSKFTLDERQVEIKCAWRKATLSRARAPAATCARSPSGCCSAASRSRSGWCTAAAGRRKRSPPTSTSSTARRDGAVERRAVEPAARREPARR